LHDALPISKGLGASPGRSEGQVSGSRRVPDTEVGRACFNKMVSGTLREPDSSSNTCRWKSASKRLGSRALQKVWAWAQPGQRTRCQAPEGRLTPKWAEPVSTRRCQAPFGSLTPGRHLADTHRLSEKRQPPATPPQASRQARGAQGTRTQPSMSTRALRDM